MEPLIADRRISEATPTSEDVTEVQQVIASTNYFEAIEKWADATDDEESPSPLASTTALGASIFIRAGRVEREFWAASRNGTDEPAGVPNPTGIRGGHIAQVRPGDGEHMTPGDLVGVSEYSTPCTGATRWRRRTPSGSRASPS